MAAFLNVEPAATARDRLYQIAARMAEQGLAAEPVAFGRRRVPEAVIISAALFAELADDIDRVVTAHQAAVRLAATEAAGGPVPTTVEDLATMAGVSLQETDRELGDPTV